MSQEIALIFIFKNPHMCLNTLQIKQHLKYLQFVYCSQFDIRLGPEQIKTKQKSCKYSYFLEK
jgi:hypothetical protein